MPLSTRTKIYYDESYTVADLRYVCQVEGIQGYSGLNKRELLHLTNRYFNKKRQCGTELSKEIAKNIRKFNNRHSFISRRQAIAVAYAKIKSKYPTCYEIYE